MDDKQRLQLDKLINANNVEDVTESIRERKHSMLIKQDVEKMVALKRQYSGLSGNNKNHFESLLETNCSFLFNNYFDIFNRIKKDEIDFDIFERFLNVLAGIEEGKLDQHQGAFQVGTLLKEIYIDSAMKRGQKIDKQLEEDALLAAESEPEREPAKDVSWKEFKGMINVD
jgi:hypothetical protein